MSRPAGSAYEAFVTIDVLARTDTVAKLTMECNKIAAQSPAEKRHAEVVWVKKDKALKSFSRPVAPCRFHQARRRTLLQPLRRHTHLHAQDQ